MHQAGVRLHRDHGDGCCCSQLPVKGQQFAKEFKIASPVLMLAESSAAMEMAEAFA